MRWVLEALVQGEGSEHVLGDIAEEFERMARVHGRRRARRWYAMEAAGTVAAWWGERRRSASESALRDARQAARSLIRAPGYTLTTIATLGVGLGGAAAVGALASAGLRPLPYPSPESLVSVWETRDGEQRSVAPANYLDWRRSATSFAGLAATDSRAVSVTVGGLGSRAAVAVVSGNFFHVLQVDAVLGRTFDPQLNSSFSGREAVLSHEAWRDAFGGSPNVLGRTFMVDEITYEVVGIAPEEVGFPEAGLFAWLRSTTEAPEIAGFPTPEALPEMRDAWYFHVVGRLAGGMSLDRAQSEMTTIARTLEATYPDTNAGHGVALVPLMDETVAGLGSLFLALGLAVGLLLMAAIVNVGHLTLARGTARGADAAVRIAVGAATRDVVRPWLWEGILAGSLGGVLGLILARVTLLTSGLTVALPRAVSPGIAPSGALAVVLAGGLIGIALSFVTASREIGVEDPFHRLRATGGSRGGRAFVTAQVAACIALLGGAGLIGRSVHRLSVADLGFPTADLLSLRVALPDARARPYPERVQVFEDVVTVIEQVPGVTEVGFGAESPLSMGPQASVRVDAQAGDSPNAGWQPVSPGFLDALGVPLRSGRGFSSVDVAEGVQVGIVNESFARTVFGAADPLGRQVTMGLDGHDRPVTIVGLVADTRTRGPASPPGPVLYRPVAQTLRFSAAAAFFAVRGSPGGRLDDVPEAVRNAVPGLPVFGVTPGPDLARPFRQTQSMLLAVLGAFATTALLLGIVGVYGVAATSVHRRRREIGVRIALGANRSRVVADVVGNGLRRAALGVPIGIAMTWVMARFLVGVLDGVSPLDPATHFAVSAFVLAVTTVALLTPAFAAARIDPVTATRDQ